MLAAQGLAAALGARFNVVEAVCWNDDIVTTKGLVRVGALVTDSEHSGVCRESAQANSFEPVASEFRMVEGSPVSITLHSAHCIPALMSRPGYIHDRICIPYWPRRGDERLVVNQNLRSVLGQMPLEFVFDRTLKQSVADQVRLFPEVTRQGLDAFPRGSLISLVENIDHLMLHFRSREERESTWTFAEPTKTRWHKEPKISVQAAAAWLKEVRFWAETYSLSDAGAVRLSRPEDFARQLEMARNLDRTLPTIANTALQILDVGLANNVVFASTGSDARQTFHQEPCAAPSPIPAVPPAPGTDHPERVEDPEEFLL